MFIYVNPSDSGTDNNQMRGTVVIPTMFLRDIVNSSAYFGYRAHQFNVTNNGSETILKVRKESGYHYYLYGLKL